MVVDLHRVVADLHCEAEVVQAYWCRLFAGWAGKGSIDATLELSLVDRLPALPEEPPFFVDGEYLPESVGVLSAYGRGQNEVLLHYRDGALVQVPLEAERPYLTGYVLQQALHYGRLEDITFTSLAPFLRRRGYYLVHAFGVVKDGRCSLIVGSSGSGKTTTGLSLVMADWELLANDILLLEVRTDGVYALPTPGGLSIREETLALLPACVQLATTVPCVQGKYDLTNQHLWREHMPEAARVTAVYFCQIEGKEVSVKRPMSQAVALVRLMEQSVDRWDEAMFDKHITMLQKLSQQADNFTLHLGRDVWQLPQLLA